MSKKKTWSRVARKSQQNKAGYAFLGPYTILFATFKEQGEGPPKGSNKYSGKNNVTKHK